MKISPAGVDAIRQREGFRTTAYQDTRGIWTIGVGHTGPEVHQGLVWTTAQVDAALAADLARFEACVNRAVHVPVTQNQFDAMVSLAYNIGESGFASSSVARVLNRAVTDAAEAFMLWSNPPELKARRESERRQFLSLGEPSNASSS